MFVRDHYLAHRTTGNVGHPRSRLVLLRLPFGFR